VRSLAVKSRDSFDPWLRNRIVVSVPPRIVVASTGLITLNSLKKDDLFSDALISAVRKQVLQPNNHRLASYVLRPSMLPFTKAGDLSQLVVVSIIHMVLVIGPVNTKLPVGPKPD